jgi:hypothetical protein
VQRVGGRPIRPPIGNELACRRSRGVHGEDPHAPPGVRIFPLQNEPECDEGVVAHPSPVGVWPNQLVAYGEPVRAVTESMQLGELGDVQEGQSSTAMAHDDSPRVPTTNIALRRDAWRLSGQSSAPTKRHLHRRPRCPNGRSAGMARPAAYPSLPQPGEAGALERDHAGVASPHVHTHPGVIAHSAGDDGLTAALLLGHELGTCTCRDQTDEMDETREDMHVVGSRLNRRAVAEAGPLCETSFHSAALIPVTLPGHLLRAASKAPRRAPPGPCRT